MFVISSSFSCKTHQAILFLQFYPSQRQYSNLEEHQNIFNPNYDEFLRHDLIKYFFAPLYAMTLTRIEAT